MLQAAKTIKFGTFYKKGLRNPTTMCHIKCIILYHLLKMAFQQVMQKLQKLQFLQNDQRNLGHNNEKDGRRFMKEQDNDSKGLSRRKMLVGTGALAAGVAVTQLGGFIKPAIATGSKAQKWPWPYKKLDPAKTAEICYNEWYRVFCGAAVINSIFSQLGEKFGEPYTSFPADAFVFLEGGQVGWGTICGSPAGANIVANLIIGPRIADANEGHHMATDIMQWYSEAKLPTFMPKKRKISSTYPKTVSESPLCHISVGKWMKEANKSLKSPERKERCARVAASTAYRLVEMLNAWHDDDYESTSDFSAVREHGITGQFNCMECHTDDVPETPGA